MEHVVQRISNGDFILELDWIVGEVLSILDDMDVAKNNLVIFTSDNGGMLNLGGQEAWMAGHRLNGNLLGFKFDAWEGGHRIPFIARWPGKIPAGSISDHMISNVDILATCAEIVNYRLKAEDAQDSYNVHKTLTGYGPQERDHLVISPAAPSHIALRQGRWLYVGKQGNGGFADKKIGDPGLGGPSAFLLTKQVNGDISNGEIK